MNHSDIQSRMASYLDGELSLDKRALFDAHLDSCEACSAELTEMRETIRLLRNLPSPEPPTDLVASVMQRIEDGDAQPGWLGQVADRLHNVFAPRFVIPATAAAAALTLTVMSGNLQLPGMHPSGPVPTAEFASIAASPTTASPAPQQQTTVRVARSAARTTDRSSTSIRVANPAPPLRRADNSAAGSFLYRVASDQLGPIRREASSRSGSPTPLFMMSDASRVGPYLGASAAPSIALGTGSLRVGERGLERAGTARMQPVVVSRLDAVPAVGTDEFSPSERRERELDMRLESLIQDPPGFAEMQERVSLAEQELWMRQLAARAQDRGDVGRVLSALEGSGDAESMRLASEFSNAVEQNRAAWAAADAEQP